MSYRTAPALFPCAGLVAGAALVQAGLRVESPGLLVALAALGLALGHLPGRTLVGLALGLLVALEPLGRASPRPSPELPVEAVGTVVDHPRPLGAEDWRLRLRLSVWRQGARIEPWDGEVQLELAGEGEPPALGTRLRARGHWLELVPLGNGLPARPGLARLRVKSRQLLTVEATPSGWARVSAAVRQRVAAGLGSPGTARASGLGAELARALVLGDPGGIPVPVRQGFVKLGLVHALSVSGLHVALVAGMGLIVGGLLPRRARAVPAVLLVGAYLAAVGPLPPLLRSAGMAALAGLALRAERPPVAANALALVAAGLVALDPRVVGELSFGLSLAATAGLVLLAPAFLAAWGRGADGAAGPVARGFAASLAAQLATAPWTLSLFALVTPWAAVANLVAAPWLALLLAASLGVAGLGAASPSLGAAALPLLDVLASPASMLAALPASPWLAFPFSLSPLAAMAGAGVLAAAWLRPRWGLVLLGAAVLAVGARQLLPSREGEPEIVFLDVGQGDAILLRDGELAMLLDGGGSLGGGDFGARVLLPVLASRGITRLERVVVSHEDRDHCGGLIDLVGLVAVREVAFGGGIAETSCGRSLARAAPKKRLAAGDSLSLGRWRLVVLHPPVAGALAGNDGSLVIRAEVFGRRFLLTGDIEAAAEAGLVASHGAGELRAEVLKVAHHGSRSSSGERFLEPVAARLAIVSAGRRNAFGHPSPVVLERFRRRGIRVLRTDRDGAVVVRVRANGRLAVELPGAPK